MKICPSRTKNTAGSLRRAGIAREQGRSTALFAESATTKLLAKDLYLQAALSITNFAPKKPNECKGFCARRKHHDQTRTQTAQAIFRILRVIAEVAGEEREKGEGGMKITEHFCDWCGKEILEPSDEWKVSINFIAPPKKEDAKSKKVDEGSEWLTLSAVFVVPTVTEDNAFHVHEECKREINKLIAMRLTAKRKLLARKS